MIRRRPPGRHRAADSSPPYVTPVDYLEPYVRAVDLDIYELALRTADPQRTYLMLWSVHHFSSIPVRYVVGVDR